MDSSSTKKSAEQLRVYVKLTGEILHKYQAIVIALIALVVIGYSMYSISELLNPELDQAVYDEALNSSQQISFDQEAIEAIRQLKDAADPVQSQLPSDRSNPF